MNFFFFLVVKLILCILYILFFQTELAYTEPTWAFTWPGITYRKISTNYISGQIFKPRNRVMCSTTPLNTELCCRQNNYLFKLLIVDRKINILFMSMERSICEAFPLILSKKSTFFQVNMIHFITRASAIHFLPLFWWLLTLPEICTDKENNLKLNVKSL